jgi:hypothetical protein
LLLDTSISMIQNGFFKANVYLKQSLIVYQKV